jgi:hydroxypyruvate isomerase
MTSGIDRRQFLASTTTAVGLAAVSTGAFAGEDSQADLKKIGRTPHTKFAVNLAMWFRKFPFLERIRRAAALGFPAVEFWPWQGKDIDATAKLCKSLGIAVAQFTAWGFRPGLNETKNHKAFVQAIKDGCKVAKKLDCKQMCVVAGDDVKGLTQAEMHANVIKGLKLAAPIAEENDVTLILEPMNIRVDHKGHCLYGSAPAIRICNAVGSSHVKVLWDLYHMQITEGDLCGHLREGFAAKRVGYLQVADTPGRYEPGTGEVHYNRVLQEAHKLGYRGYVGLECRPKEGELKAAKRAAAADVW